MNKILRAEGAWSIFDIKRTCFYQWIIDGLMVKPIALGMRARGYPQSEIDAILQARIAGKSETQIKALVAELHAARGGAV